MWPRTVRKSDLIIKYYRGSGPGGQRRNKRDTACRITHKPTGISASAQEHNSQAQNRKAAFRRLADQLVPIMKASYEARVQIDPVERVRTYHAVRNQVKDDRVPDKVWTYDEVLHGGALEDIISEVLKKD